MDSTLGQKEMTLIVDDFTVTFHLPRGSRIEVAYGARLSFASLVEEPETSPGGLEADNILRPEKLDATASIADDRHHGHAVKFDDVPLMPGRRLQ